MKYAGKPHFVPIWARFDSEVSALLDVRHCPKLQSCAISIRTNDTNLGKWQKKLISGPKFLKHLLKIRCFEKGLSKSLKKVNFISSFELSPF